MFNDEHSDLATLKVGTSDTLVKVLAGPFLKATRFGYQPYLVVEVLKSGVQYVFFLSAKSIADKLEPLRSSAHGWAGQKLRIRRASEERTSAYIIESEG